MMQGPLGAVVVGMGWMGGLHAAAYRAHPDIELLGVVETDPDRAAVLRADGWRVESHLEPLVGGASLVSVCTPDDRHEAAAVQALESGCRVLVEKPLATDAEAGQRILAARSDVNDLMVGHILRFDPRVQRARELVEAGDLGDLWHVEVWRNTTRAVARNPSCRTSVGWFLGIHDADLLLHLTGATVARIAATGRKVQSGHHDVIHALIDFEDGVVGRMENAWTLPDGRASRAQAGVRLTGSRACIEVDLGHQGLLVSDERGSIERDVLYWPSPGGRGPSNIQRELDAFVAAALADGPTPVSGEDALRAVELVAGVHAALDGQPWFADGGEVQP